MNNQDGFQKITGGGPTRTGARATAEHQAIVPYHAENTLTDIPSRSFGSVPEVTNPFQFTIPSPTSGLLDRLQIRHVITRVISTLQMKGITLAEWQRLPTIERHIVQIGSDMSDLWDWTLTHRGCSTRPKCVSSPGSPPESDKDSTAGESASRLGQSLALSRPLDRRLRWLVAPTQPRSQGANGSYHESPKSSMDSARRTHQQPNNCQSRQTSPNS